MAPCPGYWIKTVHFRHHTPSAQTTARSQMIGRLEHHEDLFKDGRPWFTEWEGTPSALYESSEEAIKGIGRVCLVRVCLFLIGCWADWLSGCVVEGKRRTVRVAQWIRRPPTKREIAGSSPVVDFFLFLICTPKSRVQIPPTPFFYTCLNKIQSNNTFDYLDIFITKILFHLDCTPTIYNACASSDIHGFL